ILADTKDLTAFIKSADSKNKTAVITSAFTALEPHLLSYLSNESGIYNLKELNEQLTNEGATGTSVQKLRTILNFWAIRNWIKKQNKEGSKNHFALEFSLPHFELKQKLEKKRLCCHFIAEYLY